MFIWIVLILVAAVLVAIRLAPSDPDRWHRPSSQQGMGQVKTPYGFVWREAVDGDGKDRLRTLDAVAMATLRTKRLAGTVEDGRITYITRSLVMGFPDYTTIGIYESEGSESRYLEINGRLRFGKSDLGVNRNRIQGWLAATQ